jgi:hypothetical protein
MKKECDTVSLVINTSTPVRSTDSQTWLQEEHFSFKYVLPIILLHEHLGLEKSVK